MANTNQKNLFARVLWLARHRPGHLYRSARCYVLFVAARWMRRLKPLDGVVMGRNVRVQRNSSLMAECPNAAIEIGDDSIIYEDARIEAYGGGRVSIGAESIIGDAHIVSRYGVKIGARFLSSWNVFIQDYDSHPTSAALRRQQVRQMVHGFRPCFEDTGASFSPLKDWDFPGAEIVIGDDVWVGAGATILKGARIGSGSIVATGAVVLKGDYPAGSLLAGNPARVVKQIETTRVVELDHAFPQMPHDAAHMRPAASSL